MPVKKKSNAVKKKRVVKPQLKPKRRTKLSQNQKTNIIAGSVGGTLGAILLGLAIARKYKTTKPDVRMPKKPSVRAVQEAPRAEPQQPQHQQQQNQFQLQQHEQEQQQQQQQQQQEQQQQHLQQQQHQPQQQQHPPQQQQRYEPHILERQQSQREQKKNEFLQSDEGHFLQQLTKAMPRAAFLSKTAKELERPEAKNMIMELQHLEMFSLNYIVKKKKLEHLNYEAIRENLRQDVARLSTISDEGKKQFPGLAKRLSELTDEKKAILLKFIKGPEKFNAKEVSQVAELMINLVCSRAELERVQTDFSSLEKAKEKIGEEAKEQARQAAQQLEQQLQALKNAEVAAAARDAAAAGDAAKARARDDWKRITAKVVINVAKTAEFRIISKASAWVIGAMIFAAYGTPAICASITGVGVATAGSITAVGAAGGGAVAAIGSPLLMTLAPLMLPFLPAVGAGGATVAVVGGFATLAAGAMKYYYS